VRILGSEVEQARRLATWLESEGGVEILDGSGPRDLLELAQDLADSDRLLCNDSGLLHLAEAVGTPVVALFGPTTRAWGYFPLDPRSRVIETELACRPCSRNGGRPCRLQHRLCMELLSVREVTDALGAVADLEAAS
jgi:ADP-heptose:LPS heptosyltransferase